MGFFAGSQNVQLAARLARVERKLDVIMAHLGIAAEPEAHDEVRRLAQEGKVIEAIKLYRDQTGAGLAEAKQHVDGLRNG